MSNNLQVSVGQYTDKGQKAINQDFNDVRLPREPLLTTKGVAIALSDGISSSDVSQIASQIAVTNFLDDYFSTPETWSVQRSGERVLHAVNSWLYSQTRQSQYRYDRDKGYVCTFSGLVIRSNTAHYFHAGDSRIYLLRGTQLIQLTDDHRLWISSAESYLSRAIGMDSKLSIDYDTVNIETGDLLLLMTDGIYETLSDEELIALATQDDDLDLCAKTIVERAYDLGSTDNLTTQIVRIDAVPADNVQSLQQELAEKPFPPELSARMEFDGYTIIRELSSSSRSHVYLAKDHESGENVVIKAPSVDLRGEKSYLERLLLEEWVARRINNQHVLKAPEQTRDRNFLYTVSEYIEGQTLAQWMVDNPNPSLETVRKLVEQIGKGLQAFHRLEMVHQDIRPENIIIDKTGTVKIIDFGSTRIEGIADINMVMDQSEMLGTLQYSAPEYFVGEVGSTRADIFSLAVLTYQLLSNKFPYGVNVARSTTKAAQRKLRYDSLHTDEHDVPLWIDETLKKGLEVDPFKRYSELSEFLYDLRHPNPSFLRKERAPIYERSPVLFWKSVAVIEALLLFVMAAS